MRFRDYILGLAVLAATCILSGAAIIIRLPSTGGGTPWSQVVGTGTGTNSIVGDPSNRKYLAASFVAANSGSVTAIRMNIRENGTDDAGSETIDVSIYSNNVDEPGSAIPDGTIAGISLNDLPNAFAVHTFSYVTSPTITSGTTYWVVIKANTLSATENATITYNGAGTGSSIERSDATPIWTNLDPVAEAYFSVDGTD